MYFFGRTYTENIVLIAVIFKDKKHVGAAAVCTSSYRKYSFI